MTDELVVTPGGYRLKSLVHFVEPGHVLDGTGGRLRKLDPSGKLVEDYGVLTPHPHGAPLMPGNVTPLRAALAAHPDLASAQTDLVQLAERVPDSGTGWIIFASFENTGQPVTSFTAEKNCEVRMVASNP